MLAVDKNQLVQNLKKRALELLQKELQFFIERYTNLATQASIVAGFAFDGLVELEVPEECGEVPLLFRQPSKPATAGMTGQDAHGGVFDWRGGVCTVSALFYVFDAAAMSFALYTVCVSSFCTVYGHRLALQGPSGSVKKAVAIMKKQLQARQQGEGPARTVTGVAKGVRGHGVRRRARASERARSRTHAYAWPSMERWPGG